MASCAHRKWKDDGDNIIGDTRYLQLRLFVNTV